MKIFLTTALLILLLMPSFLIGQIKTITPKQETNISKETLSPAKKPFHTITHNTANRQSAPSFQTLAAPAKPVSNRPMFFVAKSEEAVNPIFITGNGSPLKESSIKNKSIEALSQISEILQIENPGEEFSITRIEIDERGLTHIRMQQEFQGVPIYGAEVILHIDSDILKSFNGRSYPTPIIPSLKPAVSKNQGLQFAKNHIRTVDEMVDMTASELKYIDGEVQTSQLVLYYSEKQFSAPRLAWEVNLKPNIASNWKCIVDAENAEIIKAYNQVCRFAGNIENHNCIEHTSFDGEIEVAPMDGPAVSNAPDLYGIMRQINTYDVGGNFFLIDAVQPMFNGVQSSFPNDVVGGIITLDGQNSSASGNINAIHNVTSNNNWTNRTAVSAHYNARIAYEYFRTTFNRNSINGSGGNILSLINITENGQPMDNAFWNGAAMFYGNGNVAFTAPLAKSLDIAGHEMSHGVVQTTANLEYYGESGAINESMADVFGVMIDRNDWTLAEDVANLQVFPTGAMRDMSNPNNGGNGFGDNGWQPDHTSQQYHGNEDNGGVHINSGIPNHAYYLLAQDIGKSKAEQITYHALNNYLVKSSQFIDLRLSTIQAAKDIHGSNASEVTAVENAFAAVGIGQGSGTDSQVEINPNPGEQFVLLTDDQYGSLYIFQPNGNAVWNPLTNIGPLSKPSMTDDGSVFVYIAQDNTMRSVVIDWDQVTAEEFIIQGDPIWRNVAIARDGSRLAALTTDNDNSLWIFDYGLSQWAEWTLYNPTTGQGVPSTGNVDYADVLEFDYTGEWVMYDAQNRINNISGDIIYWDIGFIRVFNTDINNWSDGLISKLYSGLPENTSIGNPTFSKNSDFIIAFDWIDEFNQDYYMVGTNTETGDLGVIWQHTVLSYPNYSVDDDQIIFDAASATYYDPVLAFVPLASDKINNGGSATVFLDGGKWGVWFADGDRILTDIQDINPKNIELALNPNPVSDHLIFELGSYGKDEGQLVVSDMLGRDWKKTDLTLTKGQNKVQFDVRDLPAGQYVLTVNLNRGNVSKIFTKK